MTPVLRVFKNSLANFFFSMTWSLNRSQWCSTGVQLLADVRKFLKDMERETGIEPATFSLGS
jgi:hypothetical protein